MSGPVPQLIHEHEELNRTQASSATLVVVDYLEPAVAKPEMPAEIQVGFVLDPRLRVRAPFSVHFRLDQGRVTGEAPAFKTVGIGTNATEALRDLHRAIAQRFFELEAMPEQLGPDLDAVRSALRSHIQRR